MNWIFNKFGYTKEVAKAPQLTELELLALLVDKMMDVDTDVDKEAEKELFKKLEKVSGFAEYLRITSMRDVRRYFSAQTPLEQLTIKGAFSRTNYLRSKVLGIKE